MDEGRPSFSFPENLVTSLTVRALSLAEYAGMTRRNLQIENIMSSYQADVKKKLHKAKAEWPIPTKH